jgi:hypothetical protein
MGSLCLSIRLSARGQRASGAGRQILRPRPSPHAPRLSLVTRGGFVRDDARLPSGRRYSRTDRHENVRQYARRAVLLIPVERSPLTPQRVTRQRHPLHLPERLYPPSSSPSKMCPASSERSWLFSSVFLSFAAALISFTRHRARAIATCRSTTERDPSDSWSRTITPESLRTEC